MGNSRLETMEMGFHFLRRSQHYLAMENGPFIVDFPIKNGDVP
jgi:hypothetical protein